MNRVDRTKNINDIYETLLKRIETEGARLDAGQLLCIGLALTPVANNLALAFIEHAGKAMLRDEERYGPPRS